MGPIKKVQPPKLELNTTVLTRFTDIKYNISDRFNVSASVLKK